MRTVLGIDPWQSPVAATRTAPAITLAQRLGLTAPANPFDVQHTPTASASNADLPTALAMSATNLVSVTAPVTSPANITKWKIITLSAKTGTFTGSFILTDVVPAPTVANPAATRSVPRTVPFSGVLRQAPSSSGDGVIGDGYYLLPALPGAASNEKVSGEVLFQTPSP